MSETVTVTQLNSRVKEILSSSAAVRDIWVSGEISNLKRYSSGHYYFTLKDPGSEIRSVLFANSRARMDFEPQDNMKVLAFGRVDMYVQRGSYQFIIDTMRKSGVGDLYLEFEKLKRKLQAEGLFDRSRKRPLPEYPRRIGVVTSPTGAVIHDIITTSASRFPADIILAPAQVQGEGAARSIVSGIELLNRSGVDVIIVGRGGGSLEDLWAFNEEPVARAISASAAPVVSAVGHETDFTISDFVADARAPTPTGAAALILRDRAEVLNQVSVDMSRLNRAMEVCVGTARSRFDLLDSKSSARGADQSIKLRSMHLDEMASRAEVALRDVASAMGHRFEIVDSKLSPASAVDRMGMLDSRSDSLLDRARSSVLRRFDASASRLESVGSRHTLWMSEILDSRSSSAESLAMRLEGVNPLNVLSRGYGIVTDQDGRAITTVGSMSEGQAVIIKMKDGSAIADIRDKELRR